MLALLLFNAGGLFDGFADFFLKAALVVAGLVLLIEFLRSRQQTEAQAAPSKSCGCTMTLVFLVGLLLLICLLFVWIAS